MIELSEAETKLIEQVRTLEWGKVEVTVKDRKPVMISVKTDIKLDEK